MMETELVIEGVLVVFGIIIVSVVVAILVCGFCEAKKFRENFN